MNVVDIIKRARSIANDTSDNGSGRWTDEEYLEELNSIIIDIGSELEIFKGESVIDIFTGQRDYDYDANIVEIIQMRINGYEGRVVFPSTLQTMNATGRVPSKGQLNSFDSGATVAFTDFASYGKISLDPVPLAENSTQAEHVWTA